jgi:hypothetical protein
VPDLAADCELFNKRRRLNFVDYVRLAMRFGGFPGYDGVDRTVLRELANLGDGLIPCVLICVENQQFATHGRPFSYIRAKM